MKRAQLIGPTTRVLIGTTTLFPVYLAIVLLDTQSTYSYGAVGKCGKHMNVIRT